MLMKLFKMINKYSFELHSTVEQSKVLSEGDEGVFLR